MFYDDFNVMVLKITKKIIYLKKKHNKTQY